MDSLRRQLIDDIFTYGGYSNYEEIPKDKRFKKYSEASTSEKVMKFLETTAIKVLEDIIDEYIFDD